MVTLEFNEVKIIGEKEIATPKYTCGSCSRCIKDDKYCTFHQRRVEPTHNRCFDHAMYASNPIKATFKHLPSEIMDKFVALSEAV